MKLIYDEIAKCPQKFTLKVIKEGDEDENELAKVRRMIRTMNPTAKIIESTYSTVPLDSVLDTGLFSMSHAESFDGWLQEARGTHTPGTEE